TATCVPKTWMSAAGSGQAGLVDADLALGRLLASLAILDMPGRGDQVVISTQPLEHDAAFALGPDQHPQGDCLAQPTAGTVHDHLGRAGLDAEGGADLSRPEAEVGDQRKRG